MAAAGNVLKGGGALLTSCRNRAAGNVLSTTSFRTAIINTQRSNRGIFWRHLSFCAVTSSSSSSSSTPPQPADPSSPPPPLPLSSDDVDPIKDAANMLDIRVGLVLKAWRHEEADSLYVEEVDIGEPEPRIICSGLVKYVPLHHLQVQYYCSAMCLLHILNRSLSNTYYIENLVEENTE